MSVDIKSKFTAPVIISLLLHMGILTMLLLAHNPTRYRLPTTGQNAPVVRAAVIDANAVAEQIQKIKDQETQQAADQQKKLLEMKAQAEAARQAKIAETARLNQIKLDQQHALQAKMKAEEQAKQEAQHLAQLKAAQAQQEKMLAVKKQQELAQKQQTLQQQLLQQQMANEQQQLAEAQRQQQMQGVINIYRAKILMAIANQWIIPDGADRTLSCVFTIDLRPDGAVTKVQMVQSSGNAALDQAAKTAIFKASPLPVPQDPTVFNPFRHFTLKMTPKDIK